MADVAVRTAAGDERVALVELVNRVVDRGVVLSGEVTISVAEIDLLYVGLRVLLSSVDRLASTSLDVERVEDVAEAPVPGRVDRATPR